MFGVEFSNFLPKYNEGLFVQLTCIAFLVLLCRALHKRFKFDLHKIPQPGLLGLIRHNVEIAQMKDLSLVLRSVNDSLGFPKMFKFSLFGLDVLFVSDTECIKNVVMSNRCPFPIAPSRPALMKKFLGDQAESGSSLTRQGTDLYIKAYRHAFLSSLATQNLKKFIPRIDSVMDRFLDILEHKRLEGPMEMQRLCIRLTIDTIGVVAFERNLGGLDGSSNLFERILDCGHIAHESVTNPFADVYRRIFPNSEKAKRDMEAMQDLLAHWNRLVDDIQSRENLTDGSTPLWYALKKAVVPDTGESLKMITEVASLVIAGMDSTGHQLSWIIGLLATNPDKAAKLYAEIKNIDEKTIQLEHLAELPYLSAVIKEGMRVCNVALGAYFRQVPEDMTLMGYRVPKGTFVMPLSNRSSDTEEVWGDPRAFRPERWIEEEMEPDRYYPGFSCGPRDCVGQRLAILQMKMALIKLTRRYTFSTPKSYEQLTTETRIGLALEAKDGMWLQAKPRMQ